VLLHLEAHQELHTVNSDSPVLFIVCLDVNLGVGSKDYFAGFYDELTKTASVKLVHILFGTDALIRAVLEVRESSFFSVRVLNFFASWVMVDS